jgi:hypothetical protein
LEGNEYVDEFEEARAADDIQLSLGQDIALVGTQFFKFIEAKVASFVLQADNVAKESEENSKLSVIFVLVAIVDNGLVYFIELINFAGSLGIKARLRRIAFRVRAGLSEDVNALLRGIEILSLSGFEVVEGLEESRWQLSAAELLSSQVMKFAESKRHTLHRFFAVC